MSRETSFMPEATSQLCATRKSERFFCDEDRCRGFLPRRTVNCPAIAIGNRPVDRFGNLVVRLFVIRDRSHEFHSLSLRIINNRNCCQFKLTEDKVRIAVASGPAAGQLFAFGHDLSSAAAQGAGFSEESLLLPDFFL